MADSIDTPKLDYESLSAASAAFLDRAEVAEEQEIADTWRLASTIATRMASLRLAVSMVAAKTLNPTYAAVYRDLKDALDEAANGTGGANG
jgi:hypothetical protein